MTERQTVLSVRGVKKTFGNVAALRQAAGAATGEQRLLERTGMLNRRLACLPISGFVHASLR